MPTLVDNVRIRVYKALFGCLEIAGQYLSFLDSRKQLRLEKMYVLVQMDSLFLGIEKYEEKKNVGFNVGSGGQAF
jgi:hypothetical protein